MKAISAAVGHAKMSVALGSRRRSPGVIFLHSMSGFPIAARFPAYEDDRLLGIASPAAPFLRECELYKSIFTEFKFATSFVAAHRLDGSNE
jgi:hypothetical protein